MKIQILIFLLVSGKLIAQDQLINFGNLQMHPASSLSVFGDFNNSGNFNSTGGELYFSGNLSQVFSGNSNVNAFNLTMSNSSGGVAFLNNSINISNVLTFANGLIYSDANGMPIILDDATVNSSSNNSYVEGPVRKIGDDAFSFPVGKLGNLQPVNISAPNVVTDTFTAEYFMSNGMIDFNNVLESSLHHISTCEYWELNRNSGNSNVIVTLSWDGNSCGLTDVNDLVVARWDTTEWRNEGNGGFTGNTISGTVNTSAPMYSFGIFTLASFTEQNPLPVELTEFVAVPVNNTVETFWQTVSERDNDFFTVQRSSDGLNFENIGDVEGAGNSSSILFYNNTDVLPLKGTSYYRLKQTDFNGSYTYSDIRVVTFLEVKDLILYPNPTNGVSITLKSDNYEGANSIGVYSMNGQVYYERQIELEDNTPFVIKFNEALPSGVYIVEVGSGFENHKIKMVVN